MSELPNVRIPALILSVTLSDQDVRSITEYTNAVIRNTMKRLAPQLRDAERYRWLLETSPATLAMIAYRFKSATAFGDPQQAIDAAMGVSDE